MKPDTCGCCEPAVAPTPLAVDNRPSLSAIAYRVGTFASFRQAMLQAISAVPELAQLRSRRSDDYAITLIEMWAVIADILTFYQERIANEAFLRTATQRDSILRLARLIDYALKPGVAATTHLAFTTEKGKRVRLPVGTRVQSVPGQDEKPQKFETMEEIIADARWNRLRILPAPIEIHSLEGRSSAFLPPGLEDLTISKTLSSGSHLILFNNGERTPLEMLKVTEIRTEGDHITVAWSKPILGEKWTSTTFVYKAGRQFRLFGYNVPEKYLKAVADPKGNITAWEQVPISSHDLEYPSSSEEASYLFLDALYDDLKAGSLLLISGGGGNLRVTVEAVEQGRDTLGPLSNTVTKVKISPSLPARVNRRTVIIHELEGPQIRFWEYDYPEEILQPNVFIAGSKVDNETLAIGQTIEAGAYVPGVKIGLKDLDNDRKVLLVDEQQTPVLATLSTGEIKTFGGRSYLGLSLQPTSTIKLKTDSATLLGNIVLASHGETVKGEVVGDGDASVKFQSFSLKKKPVTFVPSAGPGGVENSLQVLVNNVRWREAPSLFGRGATEQVYRTSITDEGTMSIQFGDGTTGARPPSGRGNIVAKYRQGSGLSGRVRANTITTLLDRPVGLKSATNPIPSEGGADQETLDQARTNAPVTVRTFGRAVSLRDFEDLARATGEVAKARATWVWDGWQRALHLTVAGQQGSAFSPEALARVYASLTARRDPNQPLVIANYHPVPVAITATIGVDAAYVADEVSAAASLALLDTLSFERLEFGVPLYLSDIYRILQETEGVVWVDVDLFHFKDRSPKNLAVRGADDAPVQPRLRIYPARTDPHAPLTALPAQQACIETPKQDVLIMTSDGLPR